MKKLFTLIVASAISLLSGCAVYPQQSYVQHQQTYVAPVYQQPSQGYIWMFDPFIGWGWHHPEFGWHHRH